MRKLLFKRLLRSITVILACMGIFVNLFLGGAAFSKTGDVAPMCNMEVNEELYN